MIKHVCAALVMLALAGGSASAALLSYNFGLDGLQEVPPNASPGTGSAMVTLDTVTNELTWNIQFSGLVGSATAAHFHGAAPPGVNAGVKVNLGSPVSPMVGSTTIGDSDKQDLINGLWYVNVHSTVFPGGEIRGQVVPEPTALALLGAGGLALLRRRRGN